MHRLRLALAATMATVSAISISFAQDASAGSPAPNLLSGVVLDDQGAPMSGATVTLAVDHFLVNGAIEPVVFATTTADAAGRYTLTGSVPGLSTATKNIELMVSATNGEETVNHLVQVDPAATTTSGTGAARGTAALHLPALRLQAGRGEAGGSALPRSTTRVLGRAVEPATNPDPTDDGGVNPRQGATGCPIGYQGVWAPDYSVTKTRYVPVQRVTTGSHSHQTYLWNSSSATELAASFTGDGGNYSGGLAYSRTNSSGLGITLALDNNSSNLLKVQWVLVRYQMDCVGIYSEIWLNLFQWRPERPTGGNTKPVNAPTWSCPSKFTTIMASNTQVAKNSQVRWTGAFTFAGVGLDAQQTNTSSQTLTVTPDKGEKAPTVCGDDDFPAAADRVQEK